MEIGQTVYLRPSGNAARRSREIREATITKIGRKYFEVEPSHYGRFEIDTMCQDSKYVSEYKAYLSVEEIEQERENNRLLREIRGVFRYYNPDVSPSQVRAIAEILGIK